MLNILINAYAVSPTWGSEPGVGWNWIINIAKECNVFAITESEWETDIKEALDKLPQKDNIHFYFNPVTPEVRKMCWNQGNWRFYHFYKEWQKGTLEIAKRIVAENHIDVIHQLNMIGFREPGYLWSIKGIPYIWGPIGGMATITLPINILQGSRTKDKFVIGIKSLITNIQARTGRVSKAIKHADKLIVVLDSAAKIIENWYGEKDIEIIPETGLKVTSEVVHKVSNDRPLKILWVGRFIPTKKLDLALEIISKVNHPENIELHIVGWGSEQETNFYKEKARSLGIANRCIWYGKVANQDVQEMMKSSDLFLFTSVLEGTPHVILESISNNLPIICFDLCGQGVIVNDKVGWKIPVTTLSKASVQIINTLNYIDENRSCLEVKSKNCEIRKPELSWEQKIQSIVKIYHSVAKKNEKE